MLLGIIHRLLILPTSKTLPRLISSLVSPRNPSPPTSATTRRNGVWCQALALSLSIPALAASAQAQTIDFESTTPGSVVSQIPPVGFAHSDPSIDLVGSTGLPTTSGSTYLGAAYLLGASNDMQDLFLPGEDLDLQLDGPTTSLSLAVISTPGTPPQAFELSTPGGSVLSGSTPDQFAGYDEVFFLSFTSSTPFSSAQLRSSYADGLFAFHVDDIVVPEPHLIPLLASGILLLSTLPARRSHLPWRHREHLENLQ